MKLPMGGWKTWAAVALVMASAGLRYMGQDELSNTLLAVGNAVGLVGIGAKVEKTCEKPK